MPYYTGTGLVNRNKSELRFDSSQYEDMPPPTAPLPTAHKDNAIVPKQVAYQNWVYAL